MYYLKIFVAGLSLLTVMKQTTVDSSVGNQIGIYLSPGDFVEHKLSYAADCSTGGCTIKLHSLFGSSAIDMVCNGKKQTFSKDKVYGYRDCKQVDYRLFGQGAYKVMDTAGFYLYSADKLVQGEKIARPQTVYYYSLHAGEALQELTMANLERSFAGNARFRYQLEAQFHADKDLIAYDDAIKGYKIKWVFSESSK